MNQHDTPSAVAAARVTPMMEQYVEIRAANPDCLLFYRMGDFYELFFGDAEIASRALGITLTKRGKHLGEDIPMCGVPIHAADDYLQRLIALGHKVAVCEQIEDPAEARRRGSKTVVRREVVRLITPGTLTEENLLEAGRNNYLLALVRSAGSAPTGDAYAAAWLDLSTGEFRIAECAAGGLGALLSRIEPREVLVAEKLTSDTDLRRTIEELGAAASPVPASFFDPATAELRLCETFGVKTLESFGTFSRAEVSAGAALISYVDKTQIARRPPIAPPKRLADSETMRIDPASRANLELFRTTAGQRPGSLFAAVDRTQTAGGARLLATQLSGPSCDPVTIAARLDAVEFFVLDQQLRSETRRALAAAPDMLRALTRLGLDRGGPRDLLAIAAGLAAAHGFAGKLRSGPDLLTRRMADLARAPATLGDALRQALADELPLFKRDGNFIRAGRSAELDETRALRDGSRRVVAELQAKYAHASGLKNLKVRHNNVLGYYVEVSPAQAGALAGEPGGAGPFVHRQTMVSAMRFSTAELAELEVKIGSAADKALALELGIFEDLRTAVTAAAEAIRGAAEALAAIDVASALAELAVAEGYVRPLVDGSRAFQIQAGRHPVVEQALRRDGVTFVANGVSLGTEAQTSSGGVHDNVGPGGAPPLPTLDQGRAAPSLATVEGEVGAGRIWLITGPNMAGKSTFLRQNALIAIMAQAGSFVPAKSAHIGVVDSLHSRVGAADDLARGRSTFMVEMVETASILNQAGPGALVILDEIGRGTATFDGLSIAWAAIEHLHEVNRCRTVFATHYHELTALARKLPRLVNATMKVKEWKGDVVFLHEVVPGAADRSYGIQVAKLAGLPAGVIARAKQVLATLEKSDRSRAPAVLEDLPLFASAAAQAAAEPQPIDPALAALDAVQPDELSPREALEQLYALKRLRSS